jgi:DNA-binding IclR family transcriptional regulator
MEQLQIIRTTGYAIEIGENEEGSYCIAAPIRDNRDVAIAAMSLSAPISRLDEKARQTICASLMTACSEISAAFRGDGNRSGQDHTKAVA